MAFALLYNGSDSQRIQDCYQAARTNLSSNDRFNIDAVWNAGLSAWNSAGNRVYSAGPPEVWNAVCLKNGVVDRSLCDTDTHLIPISGNWARTVAAYGAVQGQPITKAGFVALLKRMGQADTADPVRGGWIANALADDLGSTAIEPFA